MSDCTQKAPNLRCYFLKRRFTNTPRRCHPADGQLSSLYPTSPSFSSFGAACAMLCGSPPASSSTPLRPSVYNASINLAVNKINIRRFCDRLNIRYIFDQTCIVLKSGWSYRARMPRLVVSPTSISLLPLGTTKPMVSAHHFTPPRQVQLDWRRLCEALPSSSPLARQKHPFLLSRLWHMSEIYLSLIHI